MLLVPSDHVIDDRVAFMSAIAIGRAHAKVQSKQHHKYKISEELHNNSPLLNIFNIF